MGLREDILGLKLKTEVLVYDETKIHVLELIGGDLLEVEGLAEDPAWRFKVFQLSVVDPAGKPIFSADDLEVIRNLPAGLIGGVARMVVDLNGLGDDEKKDLAQSESNGTV